MDLQNVRASFNTKKNGAVSSAAGAQFSPCEDLFGGASAGAGTLLFFICFHEEMAQAAPIKNLKLVTPYPRVKSTMENITLDELIPLGTPIVIHLYTG